MYQPGLHVIMDVGDGWRKEEEKEERRGRRKLSKQE